MSSTTPSGPASMPVSVTGTWVIVTASSTLPPTHAERAGLCRHHDGAMARPDRRRSAGRRISAPVRPSAAETDEIAGARRIGCRRERLQDRRLARRRGIHIGGVVGASRETRPRAGDAHDIGDERRRPGIAAIVRCRKQAARSSCLPVQPSSRGGRWPGGTASPTHQYSPTRSHKPGWRSGLSCGCGTGRSCGGASSTFEPNSRHSRMRNRHRVGAVERLVILEGKGRHRTGRRRGRGRRRRAGSGQQQDAHRREPFRHAVTTAQSRWRRAPAR